MFKRYDAKPTAATTTNTPTSFDSDNGEIPSYPLTWTMQHGQKLNILRDVVPVIRDQRAFCEVVVVTLLPPHCRMLRCSSPLVYGVHSAVRVYPNEF